MKVVEKEEEEEDGEEGRRWSGMGQIGVDVQCHGIARGFGCGVGDGGDGGGQVEGALTMEWKFGDEGVLGQRKGDVLFSREVGRLSLLLLKSVPEWKTRTRDGRKENRKKKQLCQKSTLEG